MIKQEILNAIDDIDVVRAESEMLVIESMIADIDKYIMISENCDNQDCFFQESKGVLDEVKKQGKKDSNKLITVLMFIPRLIKALIDILKKKLKDEKIGDKLKKKGEELDAIKDKKEKESRVKELNKKFDGRCECYVDEKTGKIKFKKEKGNLLETFGWIGGFTLSAVKLYENIAKHFDYANPSELRSFVDDLDALAHGNTEVKPIDVFNGGISALGDVLKLVTASTATLATAAGNIENMTQKLQDREDIKDMPNEKKQEFLKNANELSKRMTKINGIIAAAIGSITKALDYFELFGKATEKALDDNKALQPIIDEKVKAYVPEYKKKLPRKNGEIANAYRKRITEAIYADHFKEIYKEAKAELKTKQAAEKSDAKQEYLKKKEERRTDKTKNPDNNTPEKKAEVKNNGGQGSENNAEPGSD